MTEPVILSSYDPGTNNIDLDKTISRLDKESMWKDLSTIIITPAGGSIPTKVVAAWESMMCPPNNKLVRITTLNMEVGEAYSKCIESILSHPDLSNWKYICTREHDNTMPSDGLIKLLRRMEENPEYSAIGGLYFTKGIEGVAQIWGDPNEFPLNFRPQKPNAEGNLQECTGTGMGFTVFRLDMFKDPKLRKPWFKTLADASDGYASQDLYFWGDARKHGYRCAVDCSVKVGHYDSVNDFTW